MAGGWTFTVPRQKWHLEFHCSWGVWIGLGKCCVFFLVRSGNIRCYVTNIYIYYIYIFIFIQLYIYIPFMFQLCTYAPSKSLVQSMSFLFWWIMDCIHIFECMYRMGLIYHICYFSFTDNREIVFSRYSISFFTTKTSKPPHVIRPLKTSVFTHRGHVLMDLKAELRWKSSNFVANPDEPRKKKNIRGPLLFHWIYWLLKT